MRMISGTRKVFSNALFNHGVRTFRCTSNKRAADKASPITKVHSSGGIRTITLSGPARNALSLQMMEEVTNHITFMQNDVALRVIVIKAEGPIFSAGHNLKELSTGSEKDSYHSVFRAASEMMLSILRSPVPVIASVHGLAAAAGCQLVAGCDMAVCSETATFSTPGAQFGIFCSTPGVALVRAIPLKLAADMLFTGEAISANQALEYGLVSRVVPEDKLDEEVSKIAAAVIAKSRVVIELGKKFLYSQIHKETRTAYQLGEEVMVKNLYMNDAQEGIRSFFEKRKAQYKHSDNTNEI